MKEILEKSVRKKCSGHIQIKAVTVFMVILVIVYAVLNFGK